MFDVEDEIERIVACIEDLAFYEKEEIQYGEGINRFRLLDFARKLEQYQSDLSKLLWQLADLNERNTV